MEGTDIATSAWAKQSASLIQVQKTGGNLEKKIRNILAWPHGRVVYHPPLDYSLQVDAAHPSLSSPTTVVSITYTNPDTRGHSNENKLQLKLGELALLKTACPSIRVVLAIGGSGEAWLSYVLKAFQHFYDEVLLLWRKNDLARLEKIKNSPLSSPLKNQALWIELKKEWASVNLLPSSYAIPKGLVRYDILDTLRSQRPIVHHPNLIKNEIARLCLQRSRQYNGAEWRNYLAKQWHSLEMSRNYFNPVEACVEISLTKARLQFKGGVARDVQVHSLLHDLGMKETSVSEDFVLHSRKCGLPVYIQCKSSGGGREQHGKNIQNRAKEQIARSLFYRCRSTNGVIQLKSKKFIWISVLDGDWSVTERQPLKYLHMLQWAGYDRFFSAADLLISSREIKAPSTNPLIRFLTDELDCTPNP